MDWTKIGARLDEVERAVALASQMGDDEVGLALRALLMGALSEVLPDEDEAQPEDVSDDLVAIVAHLESRCRYAEHQRARAEMARRQAQSELRAAVARGVRLWEAGAALACEPRRRLTATGAPSAPVTVEAAREVLVKATKERQQQRKQHHRERLAAHRAGMVEWDRLSATHLEMMRTLVNGDLGAGDVADAVGRGKSSVYSALSELTRAGWLVRPERGVYRLTDEARRRLVPEAERADETQASAVAAAAVEIPARRRVASGSPDGIDPTARAEAVLDHLRTLDAPARTSQIAAALGQPERQVGDALYRLQRQGEVVKVDGAWALDAPEAPTPDLLDEVVALLTLQGEPQPFEALVGRVGVSRAVLSVALNDLVRRGVVVASAGVYSLTCQQQQRQRLKIYDGSGRVEHGPLAVVEVMPGGYRVVSPDGLAQDLGGRLLPSRDAVMVEGERWRARAGRAS